MVFEVLGDRLKQEGQAGHEPLTREPQRTSASSSTSPTLDVGGAVGRGAGQVRHRAARLRVDAIAERAIDPLTLSPGLFLDLTHRSSITPSPGFSGFEPRRDRGMGPSAQGVRQTASPTCQRSIDATRPLQGGSEATSIGAADRQSGSAVMTR